MLDEKGAVLRKLTSRKVEPETLPTTPTRAGRVGEEGARQGGGAAAAVWTCVSRGDADQAGEDRLRGPGRRPMVLPGSYTARLTVDGQSSSTPVEVRLDPRVTVSRADLEEQLAFALALREDLNRLSGIVRDLRSVRDQVKAVRCW